MNSRELNLVRMASLADQVADSIVDGIASGKLESGQRIVEVDLARQLHVSRVPVREAIKTLVAQGILETCPHRGARVVVYDRAWVGRTCEVRAALEKIAVRDARRTFATDPTALARLDAIVAKMELACQNGDRLSLDKADIEFHREICRASGNGIVITLWEAVARQAFIVLAKENLAAPSLQVIVDNHRKLRSAIASGDARLEEILDSHIIKRDDVRPYPKQPTNSEPAA